MDPHSEHRFPAPSLKEGCREPVLGVRHGPLLFDLRVYLGPLLLDRYGWTTTLGPLLLDKWSWIATVGPTAWDYYPWTVTLGPPLPLDCYTCNTTTLGPLHLDWSPLLSDRYTWTTTTLGPLHLDHHYPRNVSLGPPLRSDRYIWTTTIVGLLV